MHSQFRARHISDNAGREVFSIYKFVIVQYSDDVLLSLFRDDLRFFILYSFMNFDGFHFLLSEMIRLGPLDSYVAAFLQNLDFRCHSIL